MADQNVSLRIIVENPPVHFAVQRGKDELFEATSANAKQQVFEFFVRARDDGSGSAPNFLGPFAQGPVGGRFVYVNSKGRRAKVPLGGITWSLIKKAAGSKPALSARRATADPLAGPCPCSEAAGKLLSSASSPRSIRGGTRGVPNAARSTPRLRAAAQPSALRRARGPAAADGR